MTSPNIRRGQIWADNNPANKGRTIRVDRVDERYVHAIIVTNSARAQRQLDQGDYFARDKRCSETRILRSVFRSGPARTGYSPVQEVASDAADA